MPAVNDYRWLRAVDWRLVVDPTIWDGELQKRVLALVEQQPWAKHPQTFALPFSKGGKEIDLFLKIFHSSRGGAAWKNWFRRSKALQAWRQGVVLSESGINVPMTVAAGERRRFGKLQRGFLLSRKIPAQGAPFVLRVLVESSSARERLRIKRDGLLQLATVVRHLHDSGFVHGDLVATNIFIQRQADGRMIFFFMDNDRTRCYPRWLPQSLWKRNLIQLNRLPLPGITLQDRMRFFRAYLGESKLTDAEHRLARWFEQKTRQRRKECDQVDADGNFRRLMRWSGDLRPWGMEQSQ
ncbi:MAG: lipopolysaccharide kinase InaA family protein [Chloroflexota bacterium]